MAKRCKEFNVGASRTRNNRIEVVTNLLKMQPESPVVDATCKQRLNVDQHNEGEAYQRSCGEVGSIRSIFCISSEIPPGVRATKEKP